MSQLFNFWVALTGENALHLAIVIYGAACMSLGTLIGLAIGIELLRINLRKAGVNLPGGPGKNGKWKSGFTI